MNQQLLLGILLLALALIGLILTERKKASDVLFQGKPVYEDIAPNGKLKAPLFDPETRLAGKPDLLIQKGEQLIPIEIKSQAAPETPPASHVFQLMAYCLLTEKAFAVKPDSGILRYRNKEFKISYTIKRRDELLSRLERIREDDSLEEVHRSHCDSFRCGGCGYRSICDEKL